MVLPKRGETTHLDVRPTNDRVEANGGYRS
jgi:hypothetical protein